MDIKSERTKIWKLLLRRIRDQYRLVILNEETLEERISFKLSRLNVFVAIGLLSIILARAPEYPFFQGQLVFHPPSISAVSIDTEPMLQSGHSGKQTDLHQ